jgi:radical SAM superfamily enzyme YgiQ (UPF0313 family)
MYLKERFGINWIHFHDDNFLLDKDRVVEFCDKVIKNKIDFVWTCLANVDTIVKNPQILEYLKRAGCIGIEVGVESGDEDVFKHLNKQQSISDIKKAVSLIRKNKMEVFYLIMGYNIGETIDSPYITMKLLYEMTFGKLKTDIIPKIENTKMYILGHSARASPGSEFYNMAPEHGLITAKTWDEHFEDNISFVPNTFLNDIPVKLISLNEEETLKYIKDNEYNIRRCIEDFFYTGVIIIEENFNSLDDFFKFMAEVYRECDGKRSVKGLLELFKDCKIQASVSAVSMLSLVRLIGSKKK